MPQRILLSLALLAGCAAAPPPRSAPPAPRSIAEAVLVFSPASGPPVPSAAEPPARPAGPAVSHPVAVLDSAAVLHALADEIGEPVNAPQGIRVEASDEGGEARLVISAPHPAAALATCRAYARIAEAQARSADPVEGWLVAETERIEHELAALDRSLSILPELSSPSMGSVEATLLKARIGLIEAKVVLAEADRNGMTDEALVRTVADATSPVLAALGRLLLAARRDAQAATASGQGPAHPNRVALATRIHWLEARFASQRANEAEAARAIEASLTALPPHADQEQVGRALAARVRRVDAEHASSLDPVPLQILAVLVALLEAEDATLSVRLGPAHPERLAARARLDALAASFARERDLLAGDIEAAGHASAALARTAPGERDEVGKPFPGYDPRPGQVRDQAAALAMTLARLAEWRQTARPGGWRVRVACHLVVPS